MTTRSPANLALDVIRLVRSDGVLLDELDHLDDSDLRFLAAFACAVAGVAVRRADMDATLDEVADAILMQWTDE